jgi:hypothetical protein
MRRQSQPEGLQCPTNGLQVYKLSDVQPPQQEHKNRRKPKLTGQEMPQYAGHHRKVQKEHGLLKGQAPTHSNHG